MIDGYCLGHTEFVTKLCVPPAYPHLLISGGGDDYLILWDWPARKIMQRFHLKNLVGTCKSNHTGAETLTDDFTEVKGTQTEAHSALRICVSNIQALEIHKEPSGFPLVEIIVTCEG